MPKWRESTTKTMQIIHLVQKQFWINLATNQSQEIARACDLLFSEWKASKREETY